MKKKIKQQASTLYLSIFLILFLTFFLLSRNKSHTVFPTFNNFLPVDFYSKYTSIFNKMFDEKLNFNESLVRAIFNSSFERCETCKKFPYDKAGGSTENDLVFGILYGYKHGIIAFVRTLRSTGCKSKVLFLVSKGYTENLSQREKEIIEDCGVVLWEIFTIENTKFQDKRFSKVFICFRFIYEFGYLFDRMLITDVYDVVFQKDPFTNVGHGDKVSFSKENKSLTECIYNNQWIRYLDSKYSDRFYKDKIIINAGVAIGHPLKVLELYSSIFLDDIVFNPEAVDQSVLNYRYYNRGLPMIWVDFEGQYYVSAAYMTFEDSPGPDGYMHLMNHSNSTPIIVHQYDKIGPMVKYIMDLCPPPEGIDSELYIRNHW